jgi:nucleoside-diphosphate-sugar epimerase
MKIFLTGGTGFVGSHLINAAHKCGIEIIALRRPGAMPRIALFKEPFWVDGQIDEELTSIFDGVDVFVHLASHTPNPPYDSLANCLYWNVYASLKLAEQAKKNGVNKFLIAGSCFEYGDSANLYEKIPPNAPLLPNLSYPISKASASIAFIGFAAENLSQVQILRFFQISGDGEVESRLWPSLRSAAKKGQDFPMSMGEQVRDFMAIEDLVSVLLQKLDFQRVIPGVASVKNIGTGKAQTLREFAEHWWDYWGGRGTLRFGELPYRKNELMHLVPFIED